MLILWQNLREKLEEKLLYNEKLKNPSIVSVPEQLNVL